MTIPHSIGTPITRVSWWEAGVEFWRGRGKILEREGEKEEERRRGGAENMLDEPEHAMWRELVVTLKPVSWV